MATRGQSGLSRFARYPGLEGQSVVITGGGSGIGAAIVESFVHQGSKTAFVDIDAKASEKLCRQIEKRHGKAPLFIPCDLKDIAMLRAAVAAAAKAHGPIATLVNNAANDQRHDWTGVTPDYWDERMATNLRPMFFAIQAVVPHMKRRRGGSIINFGSISWKVPQGGMPAYTTAKAAVHGLTRGMARDLGQDGIRVNTVVPGWVMTERQLKLWVTPESEKELDKAQCLKGRIQPIDLARMVLFLASDDARMCTAQEFTVDAGWV
jgi:NAD(P)-dependent dehydrogenase (short-subunit alcohol dehydrogenase family)